MGTIGMNPNTLYQHTRYWLPAAVAGGLAWIAFLLIGQTPIVRASGLALVVIGMALTLRPMGSVLTVIGAMAFAFSPSFWIQTGGAESLNPLAILLTLAGAAGVSIGVRAISRQTFISGALGLLLFAAVFLLIVGQPRSLRLTTLMTAWTLYLLIDGLLLSNPRPESPPTGELGVQHTYGLLILLAIGVFNDPLFVLLAPAIVLALFLSHKQMPVWYWVILLALVVFGARGMIELYFRSTWWSFPAAQAEALGVRVPFIIAEAWREPSRWIKLIDLVVRQFSVAGLALGVIGLARLSRWYPPIGVVTMIAYGAFGIFGLVYFGGDSSVLLLPLLMIQIIWMTYAVYTFSQWMQKSMRSEGGVARWLAPAAFTALPLFMFLRIIGVV
jgi:hypothetical protein